MLSMDGFGGYKAEEKARTEETEKLAPRNKVKEQKRLERYTGG